MKKLILVFAIIGFVIIACQDDVIEVSPNQEISAIDMSDFYLYTDDFSEKPANDKHGDKCFTMKVLNRQLKENPGLYQKMYTIEKHTRTFIAAKGKPPGTPGGGNGNGGGDPEPPVAYNGTVTIPVVVNIIETFSEEVTQAQINSQIAILNEDFNNSNPNTSSAPSGFAGLIANIDVSFSLDHTVRKISSKTRWGTRDAMKSSKKGGIDATDTSTYLNIWVCNIGGGILGYAQFPGGSSKTDGVVIGIDYFGETSGPYGDGRTATHEVGHWLNLRHIWGDGGCSYDDFVTDTPISDRANYGCPGLVVHCETTDMTMNYMDYVYDDCMYMFTLGQSDRMRALFASNGVRVGFVN